MKKQNKICVATPIQLPDEFVLHSGVPPLYRSSKMKNRIRVAAALSIWCTIVIFPASLLFLFITEKKPVELYFTEDYLFYEMLICIAALFLIGLAIGGTKRINSETSK